MLCHKCGAATIIMVIKIQLTPWTAFTTSYHLISYLLMINKNKGPMLFPWSNIEEFCLYFKQLPSLEGVKTVGRSKVYQSRSIRELNDAVMAEELRKVIISLTDNGSTKSAISPESLFLVIWKVVPRFRYVEYSYDSMQI